MFANFDITSIPSWPVLQEFYVLIVTEYVPGPLSFSYFIPFVLLPIALLISPSSISHRQLRHLFLPPILASVFHAWYVMGGVDVTSVDGLLWSTFLIGLKDVRRDFKRLHIRYKPRSEGRNSSKHVVQSVVNGAIDGTPKDGAPNTVQEGGMLQDVTGEKSHNNNSEAHHDAKYYQVDEQAYPKDFTPRLIWVFTLIFSTRMYSWKIGTASHDRHQLLRIRNTPSRLTFVFWLLPTILFTQTLLPLLAQLALHDPAVSSITPPKDYALWSSHLLPFLAPRKPPPRTVAFLQEYVPVCILRPLMHGFWAFGALNTGFALPAPFIVLTNYLVNLPSATWSPHTLPDYFGSFSTILDYGLGGMWGRWWHQHMRVMVSAPGLAVADHFGMTEEAIDQAKPQRKEKIKVCRHTLQVVSAFFFSGITHMGLVPPLVCGVWGLRLRIASFFWSQALAVILERITASVWRARAPLSLRSEKRATMTTWLLRMCRLAWVVTWLCLTLPLLEQPFNRLRWWKVWPPLFLPQNMLWYLEGEWIP